MYVLVEEILYFLADLSKQNFKRDRFVLFVCLFFVNSNRFSFCYIINFLFCLSDWNSRYPFALKQHPWEKTDIPMSEFLQTLLLATQPNCSLQFLPIEILGKTQDSSRDLLK